MYTCHYPAPYVRPSGRPATVKPKAPSINGAVPVTNVPEIAVSREHQSHWAVFLPMWEQKVLAKEPDAAQKEEMTATKRPSVATPAVSLEVTHPRPLPPSPSRLS